MFVNQMMTDNLCICSLGHCAIPAVVEEVLAATEAVVVDFAAVNGR
jgi:hypothetical protein